MANSGYTAQWVERLWGRAATVVSPPVRPAGTRREAADHPRGRTVLPQRVGPLEEAARARRGVPDRVRAGPRGLGAPPRGRVQRRRARVRRDRPQGRGRAAGALPRQRTRRGPRRRSSPAPPLFWHAAGLGEDPTTNPDRFEHFGISVVEAMSAGAVPMVYEHGGPGCHRRRRGVRCHVLHDRGARDADDHASAARSGGGAPPIRRGHAPCGPVHLRRLRRTGRAPRRRAGSPTALHRAASCDPDHAARAVADRPGGGGPRGHPDAHTSDPLSGLREHHHRDPVLGQPAGERTLPPLRRHQPEPPAGIRGRAGGDRTDGGARSRVWRRSAHGPTSSSTTPSPRGHCTTSSRGCPATTAASTSGRTTRPGEVVGGIAHEDLMELSFADASIDQVLSSDVLEHVPDPYRAHAEVHRVLRPNGHHVFTVPFHPEGTSRQCARPRRTGRCHRAPGGTRSTTTTRSVPGRCSCSRSSGLEMLVRLAEIGFSTRMYHLWKPWHGIVGPNALVFDAAKRA